MRQELLRSLLRQQLKPDLNLQLSIASRAHLFLGSEFFLCREVKRPFRNLDHQLLTLFHVEHLRFDHQTHVNQEELSSALYANVILLHQ